MQGFDPLLNIVLDNCIEYLRGRFAKSHFVPKRYFIAHVIECASVRFVECHRVCEKLVCRMSSCT